MARILLVTLLVAVASGAIAHAASSCSFIDGYVMNSPYVYELGEENTERDCESLVKTKKPEASGVTWVPSTKRCSAEYGDYISTWWHDHGMEPARSCLFNNEECTDKSENCQQYAPYCSYTGATVEGQRLVELCPKTCETCENRSSGRKISAETERDANLDCQDGNAYACKKFMHYYGDRHCGRDGGRYGCRLSCGLC